MIFDKVSLVTGGFDPIHSGHISYFKRAKDLSNYLVVGLLFFIMGYGLYLTIGPGKIDLRDPIDEHAKMHELGIAHGHGGNKGAYEMSGKLEHNHD